MISVMVEKQEIDLIVIGTHGRRGVEKLLLGSTAEEIRRCARSPIVMVEPENRCQKQRPIRGASSMPRIFPRNSSCRAFLLVLYPGCVQRPLSARMQAADFFRLRFM
jgi:hypothetical protein